MFKITVYYSSRDIDNRTPRHYMMGDRHEAVARIAEEMKDEYVQSVMVQGLDILGNAYLEYFPERVIKAHWENTFISGNLHRSDFDRERGQRAHQCV